VDTEAIAFPIIVSVAIALSRTLLIWKNTIRSNTGDQQEDPSSSWESIPLLLRDLQHLIKGQLKVLFMS
jgi:hypothetical protein